MAVLIRSLVEEDIERACVLMADVFRLAYSRAYSDKHSFDAYVRGSFHPERYVDELRRNCIECLVAEVEDELVGVLKLSLTSTPEEVPGRRAVEVEKLYVREQHHGSGLAGSLLQRAFERAERAGFDAIWLCVWEHNPRARAFYRKHGFEAVGDMVTPMNDVPFRDYVMWRSLV